MRYKYVKKAIVAAGGIAHKIHAAEGKSLMEQWRQVYSSQVKRRTGKWVYDGLDWHTFSWEFSPSKLGEEALQLYKKQTATEVIVIPAFDEIIAYTCVGCCPPDFSEMFMDLYVFESSLNWTMAFTHEQPEIGPYFCKREWANCKTT